MTSLVYVGAAGVGAVGGAWAGMQVSDRFLENPSRAQESALVSLGTVVGLGVGLVAAFALTYDEAAPGSRLGREVG